MTYEMFFNKYCYFIKGLSRFLVRYRDSISPFHPIIEHLPQNCSILDIGCGTGIFANMALAEKRAVHVIGTDLNHKALQIAKEIAQNIKGDCPEIEAKFIPDLDAISEYKFDVISFIDVLHHVKQADRHSFLLKTIGFHNHAGPILIKDMTPHWFWWPFNFFHDLVLARQIVHPVDFDKINAVLQELGYTRSANSIYRRFWYQHRLVVYKYAQ